MVQYILWSYATATANSVRNTPNMLVLSSILLRSPVCGEEIVACIVSGNDVWEALNVSMGEAILASAFTRSGL